jgi:hypothetical protein
MIIVFKNFMIIDLELYDPINDYNGKIIKFDIPKGKDKNSSEWRKQKEKESEKNIVKSRQQENYSIWFEKQDDKKELYLRSFICKCSNKKRQKKKWKCKCMYLI